MLKMEDVARHCDEMGGECKKCLFFDEKSFKKHSLVPCRIEEGKKTKKKPYNLLYEDGGISRIPPYSDLISEEALYDLCDHIVAIVLPALRRFEHYAGSIPSALFVDGDPDKTDMEKAEKEWHEILQKMIWSFDQYKRDEPDAPWKKGMSLNSPEQKAYNKRFHDGFQLFGEYLTSLWL